MQSPRCAIYARVSADKTGAGLAVERQESDCRELVARLGGEVVAVFSDNSISAYSGKHRPGYQALLEAMRSGRCDVVVSWHGDRLHRSMVELEEYVNASESHQVATHTVKAGAIDLATPSGRLVARQLGAVARYEVEHAIERVKAAKLQAAKAGRPSGGNRAYGYMQGGLVINEAEAKYVREAIDRYINGDTWRAIALDFNARGILTANGKLWKPVNVGNMATLPRHAGYREHQGILYDAVWPPIISRDTYEQLKLAVKRRREQDKRRTYAKKHLLTGFVFRGLCSNRMTICNAQNRDGSYSPCFSCRKIDPFGNPTGCGKVKRRKEPVEHLVVESLLYRLDTPNLGDLLHQQDAATDELRDLLQQRDRQSARLQEIMDGYASGELSLSEYKAMKATAQAKNADLDRVIGKLTSQRTIASIPVGQSVREAWENGDLSWRRQLLDTVIEGIEIYPRELGDQKVRYQQWVFNPERVAIRWRA